MVRIPFPGGPLEVRRVRAGGSGGPAVFSSIRRRTEGRVNRTLEGLRVQSGVRAQFAPASLQERSLFDEQRILPRPLELAEQARRGRPPNIQGIPVERKEYGLWGAVHDPNLESYEFYFLNDSVVQSGVLTKMALVTGCGHYTTVDDERNKDVKGFIDRRAEDVNIEFEGELEGGLDLLLQAICLHRYIYGFCPVVRRDMMLLPPRTVKYYREDGWGTILGAIQQVPGVQRKPVFRWRDLAWLTYLKFKNNWYGMSMVKSIFPLVEGKGDRIDDMDAAVDRYGNPKTIWEVLDQATKDNLVTYLTEELKPDEDIVLTGSFTLDGQQTIKHEVLQIDPRARFWEFTQYVDLLIFEGLAQPLLGYMRNATEASATKILEVIQLVTRMDQRYMARFVERMFYRPWIREEFGKDVQSDEDFWKGFFEAKREVPRLNWGMPQIPVVTLADFIQMARLGDDYFTATEFRTNVRKLGIILEEQVESGEGKKEDEGEPGSQSSQQTEEQDQGGEGA